MVPLSWITDDALNEKIDLLVENASRASEHAERNIVANVIDPFSSLLVAKTFDIKAKSSLRGTQRAVSAIHGLSNHLGTFHQSILGSVAGWEDHDAGYDLECFDKQMLAEVKNKHNTMNASNREKVVDELKTAVRQKGRGWQAYLVIIIPKRPVRYEEELPTAPKVLEIDGASFYHKVTGCPNAIHDLFNVVSDKISPSAKIAKYCRKIMTSSLPPRI